MSVVEGQGQGVSMPRGDVTLMVLTGLIFIAATLPPVSSTMILGISMTAWLLWLLMFLAPIGGLIVTLSAKEG